MSTMKSNDKLFFIFLVSFQLIIHSQPLSFNRYKNRLLRIEKEQSTRLFERSNEICEFGICEFSENYPEQEIISVLNESSQVRTFFGSVIKPHDGFSIVNRFGGDDTENFCRSYRQTRYPKTLPDVNGKKKFIVNVSPPYVQAITFESCDPGDEKSFCYNFRGPYAATCKQKYTVIKLLKYENDEVDYGEFPIPSSCVCVYSSIKAAIFT